MWGPAREYHLISIGIQTETDFTVCEFAAEERVQNRWGRAREEKFRRLNGFTGYILSGTISGIVTADYGLLSLFLRWD